MPNQPGNRWYRIAPSVLISAAINAAIIIALSVVIGSPKKDVPEYQVNYAPVKTTTKIETKQKPIKSKPGKKNNNKTAVKKATPAEKKKSVAKPVKPSVKPEKKIVQVKTVTPTPLKPVPENNDKKNTQLPNPAAASKNETMTAKNNPLPGSNSGGGGSRNNNIANDTPHNNPGNGGNTGLPGKIVPGNISGRPGLGDGNDTPSGGEPTFGNPLEPGYGSPGGNGPGDGTGKNPGNGGDGPGGNGHASGIGPGNYRGDGDGDGPGKGGWGGDGSGEPRNLNIVDSGDKPGEKSKTGNTSNPGVKMNPESGTPGYSRKARAIKLVKPEYPSVARRRGQEGDVYVRVDINEEGRPIGKPVVVISSGIYQLDQSAIEYVQNTDFIQYVPAMKGGKPAKDSVVIQVTFKLDG